MAGSRSALRRSVARLVSGTGSTPRHGGKTAGYRQFPRSIPTRSTRRAYWTGPRASAGVHLPALRAAPEVRSAGQNSAGKVWDVPLLQVGIAPALDGVGISPRPLRPPARGSAPPERLRRHRAASPEARSRQEAPREGPWGGGSGRRRVDRSLGATSGEGRAHRLKVGGNTHRGRGRSREGRFACRAGRRQPGILAGGHQGVAGFGACASGSPAQAGIHGASGAPRKGLRGRHRAGQPVPGRQDRSTAAAGRKATGRRSEDRVGGESRPWPSRGSPSGRDRGRAIRPGARQAPPAGWSPCGPVA